MTDGFLCFKKGDRLEDILKGAGLREFKKKTTIKAVQIKEPFKVETLEGTMSARANDWLAIGVKGELYPIADEVMQASYEPADSPDRPDERVKAELFLTELAENLEGDVIELSHAVPFYDSINESDTAKALRDVKDIAHKLRNLASSPTKQTVSLKEKVEALKQSSDHLLRSIEQDTKEMVPENARKKALEEDIDYNFVDGESTAYGKVLALLSKPELAEGAKARSG